MKKIYLNRYRVIEYVMDNRLSFNDFFKKCKIGCYRGRQYIEDENKPITIRTLFKIARGMQCSVNEIAVVGN